MTAWYIFSTIFIILSIISLIYGFCSLCCGIKNEDFYGIGRGITGFGFVVFYIVWLWVIGFPWSGEYFVWLTTLVS